MTIEKLKYDKPKKRKRKKITDSSNPADFAFNRDFNSGNSRVLLNDTALSFETTNEIRNLLDEAFQAEDYATLGKISRHFYKVSGIYGSAVRYLQQTLTYDYLIFPKLSSADLDDISAIEKETFDRLKLIETGRIKNSLNEIGKDTIIDGVSYVYMRRRGKKIAFQTLPIKWCKIGGIVNGFPTVQFNLDFFDENFPDIQERLVEVSRFPKEIVEAYYKVLEARAQGSDGKMPSSISSKRKTFKKTGTWLQLEPKQATAFYFNTNLQPILSNSFYTILDLMEVRAVEKVKNENELYNLVVQQFPLDKEGEPVIDFVEMQQFHNTGKKIFENSNQTDLLTTFAEVKNVNLNESMGEQYDYKPWKLDVYGDLGISPQLFSTEGNLALERSVTVDESLMFSLLTKFEDWMNYYFFHQLDNADDTEYDEDARDKTEFSIWFPPVTYANRQELSKSLKDFATFGYSKLLPAIVLGQSQLNLMSLIRYENEVIGLSAIMEPLQSSHTQSGNSNGGPGRPELPNSKKSEKTIQNQGG